MGSEINFSGLWSQRSATAPSMEALLKSAKRVRVKERLKVTGLMLILAATGVFIVLIKMNYQSAMFTTTLGIIMILVALAMVIVSSLGTFSILMRNNSGISIADQLEHLIRLKKNQEFMHRIIMSLYFILLSTGIFLSMIEYALKMKLFMAIIAYSITAAWIAFNWFYLRPRTIRKKQAALNILIDEFRRMQEEVKEKRFS
jgi:hypothetical protein